VDLEGQISVLETPAGALTSVDAPLGELSADLPVASVEALMPVGEIAAAWPIVGRLEVVPA